MVVPLVMAEGWSPMGTVEVGAAVKANHCVFRAKLPGVWAPFPFGIPTWAFLQQVLEQALGISDNQSHRSNT